MSKKAWFTAIGAAIGTAIAGPWGAAIGGWLGYNLGNESLKIHCPYCKGEILIEPQKNFYWGCPNCKKGFIFDFLVADEPITDFSQYKDYIGVIVNIFCMGFVAKIDGIIDSYEKDKCLELFDGVFSNSSVVLEVFDSELVKKEDETTFWNNQLRERFLFSLKDLPEEEMFDRVVRFFAFLYEIANVSNGIHPKQEVFIYELASSIGVEQDLLKEIKAKVLGFSSQTVENFSQLESAFKLLEVSQDIDCASLKKVYKKKLFELHPDKYQNLPDEVKKVLEEKVKELNNAFSIISQYKNCK